MREHLRILKLPEELQAKVAAGEIPMKAVKALAELEDIHAGLARTAVGQVLSPDDA